MMHFILDEQVKLHSSGEELEEDIIGDREITCSKCNEADFGSPMIACEKCDRSVIKSYIVFCCNCYICICFSFT